MIGETQLRFKDREFTAADLELIREVVGQSRGLSRQELANTVCELLGWRRPAGGLKTWECKELLARLAEDGGLELPRLRRTKPAGASARVPESALGEAGDPVRGGLGEVGPARLRLVETEAERLLWRELVGRWHYLGFKMAFGGRLQYLVELPGGRPAGCMQFSSPAWRMAARDRWIGWNEAARRRNLQRVLCQSRFLILPWIRVRGLASHVLSRSARRVAGDWSRRYGVEPLLLETLVEEGRHAGTCYRAANWLALGRTAGRGRMDRQRRTRRRPKLIFVYPLRRRARETLRGSGGTG